MITSVPLRDFLKFAKTKRGAYNFCSDRDCAIAQFGKAQFGSDFDGAGTSLFYLKSQSSGVAFKPHLGSAALDHPRTWPALIERIEAILAKEPADA